MKTAALTETEIEITPQMWARARSFVNTMEIEGIHVDLHETTLGMAKDHADPKFKLEVEAARQRILSAISQPSLKA